MKRRDFIAGPLLLALVSARVEGAVSYPPVLESDAIVLPRDFGSHPAFRTEWWYVTGWLNAQDGRTFGFQVTFFRDRPGVAEDNPSRFAPKQLLLAHAALADPAIGRLRHDQRVARAGFGLAEAHTGTTDVHIGNWSLRNEHGAYRAAVVARDFTLDLRCTPTQPTLLQGQGGYSRKGANPLQASHYYSEPQLAVSGSIGVQGKDIAVSGTAWLDHEWSSELMVDGAVGWDWTGLNLDDGTASMAFRMRGHSGKVLWAGGTQRAPDGGLRTFAPGEVQWLPQRQWRSPRTAIDYPVAMRLQLADETYDLVPLFDDQELDARLGTGAVYWEGAVRALRQGRPLGRGYLELTGYGEPLTF
jgi:predicted secreted hydrolase